MTAMRSDSTAPTPLKPGSTTRRLAASGHIYFWQGGSLWIGSGNGVCRWHAHHAHQIALALKGEFRFRSEPDGKWTPFDAAIVPSLCPHEFALKGATVAHLFVEPESTEGRALASRFGTGGIAALGQPAARACADTLLHALQRQAGAHAMQSTAREATGTLAGTTASPTATGELDARVARALEFIRSRVRAPTQLADAAAAAKLSPSRFSDLFIQETGSTFRSYLLWLRINTAIEAATAGASWTEAAHDAGFSDSAHLSRTHKRMFGIEPTAIRFTERHQLVSADR